MSLWENSQVLSRFTGQFQNVSQVFKVPKPSVIKRRYIPRENRGNNERYQWFEFAHTQDYFCAELEDTEAATAPLLTVKGSSPYMRRTGLVARIGGLVAQSTTDSTYEGVLVHHRVDWVQCTDMSGEDDCNRPVVSCPHH